MDLYSIIQCVELNTIKSMYESSQCVINIPTYNKSVWEYELNTMKLIKNDALKLKDVNYLYCIHQ